MIYITGDTHIPVDVQKLNSRRFAEQKQLTENDFVIICGDFGGVWDNSNEEHYWRKWLEKKKFTTLFADGNHENFEMLNKFPEIEFYGGKAHKISDKIIHLMRGQFFDIDGLKIFTFGGANSHDKEHRKEGKNWWKEEMPSKEEYETAFKNLELNQWKADVVITHCAPSSLNEKYEKDELTEFLESVKNKLTYRKWFFGHYHKDKQFDSKHCMVFDKVIKLEL